MTIIRVRDLGPTDTEELKDQVMKHLVNRVLPRIKLTGSFLTDEQVAQELRMAVKAFAREELNAALEYDTTTDWVDYAMRTFAEAQKSDLQKLLESALSETMANKLMVAIDDYVYDSVNKIIDERDAL